MHKIWLTHYPAGVPAQLKTDQHPSLVALLEQAFLRYRERVAYKFMGCDYRVARIDEASRALAAYLQSVGLERGDRVALMMPNLPQYPVAVAAVLRGGYVVVNLNPQHTPHELRHQLKDCGARAILLLEHCAASLQEVFDAVAARQVILVSMGDMLGGLKGRLVNHLLRNVKKTVPPFEIVGAVRFNDALLLGRSMKLAGPGVGAEDIALLQYTAGTTGASKGAVLLHRNLVANVLQAAAWNQPALAKIAAGEQPTTVCVLPLHQVFGFTANMMLSMHIGGCNILVPNPSDTSALLKQLARHRFHSLPADDSMFSAMAQHADSHSVDWSHLVLAVGADTAAQPATARRWLDRTGCPICAGYSLAETGPMVTCNPVDSTPYNGSIGLPLPNTELALLDDAGQEVPPGMPGEITIRGPQVMAGYWQHPDETAKVTTRDGFFRTGDVGTVDEGGHFRIVDRKKDMILVSGLKVCPNEIEALIRTLPGVLKCAAVGVPDLMSGEAVKLVVVKSAPLLSEDAIRGFCETHLTGYKRPKSIEFRSELPRSTHGRILRRELRA